MLVFFLVGRIEIETGRKIVMNSVRKHTTKSERARLSMKKFLVVRIAGFSTTTVTVSRLPMEPKRVTSM